MSGKCPVCGCGEAKAFCPARDRFRPFGEIYHLASCSACGLVYLFNGGDARPPEELYPEAYFGTASGKGSLPSKLRSALERLYFEAIYRSRLRRVGRFGPTAKTILDVGSGGGEFVRLCAEAGFEAFGVEMLPYDNQANCGPTKIFHDDFGRCDLPLNYFDIATMYNSLEHFNSPLEALGKIRNLLKPGGLIIVQVPNISSLQFRLFRGRWFAIEAPRHRVHFSAKTLRAALEKVGFKIERLSHFCLRDSSAALVSSFWPSKAPMTLKGIAKSEWITWTADLAYAALLGPAFLFAFFEALLGKGGSIMAIAKKCP